MRQKPFNPLKIHDLLEKSLMLDIDDNNGDDKESDQEEEEPEVREFCDKGHTLEMLFHSPYVL